MKTKEILDKYRKIIGGVLKVEDKEIRFFIVKEGRMVPDNMTLSSILENPRTLDVLKEIKEVEYFEPEKDENNNETGVQLRMTRWENWSEGSYAIFVGQNLLSTFELYKLPHCCAIIVSCKAFVNNGYRNKRIGTIMNSFRQDIGRQLGYSLMMCTDIESNTHQRQLLKTNGWNDIYEVKNKRTQNNVHIHVINL